MSSASCLSVAKRGCFFLEEVDGRMASTDLSGSRGFVSAKVSFRFETHRLDRLTIICAVDEGSRIRGVVDEGSCGIWKTCAHTFALLL